MCNPNKRDLYIFKGQACIRLLQSLELYLTLDNSELVKFQVNEIWLYLNVERASYLLNHCIDFYNLLSFKKMLNHMNKPLLYDLINELSYRFATHFNESININTMKLIHRPI